MRHEFLGQEVHTAYFEFDGCEMELFPKDHADRAVWVYQFKYMPDLFICHREIGNEWPREKVADRVPQQEAVDALVEMFNRIPKRSRA